MKIMPIGLVEQRENFFFGVSLCISANSTLGYWKFTKLAEGLNCYSRLCLSPSLSGKCRHGAMATDLGWGQKAECLSTTLLIYKPANQRLL